MFPYFDFKLSEKENGRTRILRSYSANSYASPSFDPFGKYVIEKIITERGVDSKVRKVGVDATESEFKELNVEAESETVKWAKPAIQAITLKDLLLEPDAGWFEFDPDEAQLRNGFYRIAGDAARFSAIERTFTPEIALKALNQKLGVSQPNEDPASTSGSPVRSTPTPVLPSKAGVEVPTPEPRATPTPAKEETDSFPFITLTIVVTAILALAIYVLRRKST